MDAAAPFNTGYSVASVTDANTFTITVANSGLTAVAKSASQLWTARVTEHNTLSGLTVPADGNYAFPPIAFRLNISSYTSGSATLNAIQVN
jgi:hypothetical protein